jgi:hypothetical protein
VEVLNPNGLHSLAVHATDGDDNVADASAPYLVFGSAWGSVLGDGAGKAGTWQWLVLRMDLGRRAPDPVAGATTQAVDCESGGPLGEPEPAEIRSRLGYWGHYLTVTWDTDRHWAGSCRTLTLSFSADGWTGADATFGPVGFTRRHHTWCWWWRG